jgi:hypothetical protein
MTSRRSLWDSAVRCLLLRRCYDTQVRDGETEPVCGTKMKRRHCGRSWLFRADARRLAKASLFRRKLTT